MLSGKSWPVAPYLEEIPQVGRAGLLAAGLRRWPVRFWEIAQAVAILDGGGSPLRRGNCQEERIRKLRVDAAFVRPGIRSVRHRNGK